MDKVIEAKELCFGYGSELILDRIGFCIHQGEFVGIIGSNGTGKSTLLKLLLAQLEPVSGEIRLLEQDIRAFKQWSKIGYVAQNGIAAAASFPATAAEVVQANLFSQIGLLRLPRKEHREQALHALELVGMQDYAKRLIGNLSGGQQQRVMLARVLVNQPALMLLDEPTTGIDAKSAEALYELLQRLNRESGIAVVMVTHDVARTSSYAGRMLCLENGSIVELDRHQLDEELFHKHKHPEKGQREGEPYGNLSV